MRGVRRAAILLALLLMPIALAKAQSPLPEACRDIEKRFDGLIDTYINAAGAAIAKAEPAQALERARKAVQRGDRAASIVVVGMPLMLRGRADRFNIATVRQVCGFADANRHPLHQVTCAYFNALNPLGNRASKLAIVERHLAAVLALPPGDEARTEGLARDAEALEACIRSLPKQTPV